MSAGRIDIGAYENRAPVAIPGDVPTLRASGDCVAGVNPDLLNFQSRDDDGDPLTFAVTPPGPYPVGGTGAYFWAIDNKGASNGTSIVISVVDADPPHFTNYPGAGIVVALPPGSNTVQVIYEVGAADDCSSAGVSCNWPSGSYFPLGATEVICTAADAGGNTAEVRFTVRVSAPEFSVANLGLPPVSFGAAAWGDYDNDGRLDLVLSGGSTSGFITQIWRNQGDNTFSNINANLPGLNVSAAAWGDLDNDGRLDLAIAGSTANNQKVTQLWRNTGTGFVNLNAGITGVDDGALAWGDYDNDGRLDLLLTGVSSGPRVTQIWRNQGNNTFSNINANLPGTSTGGAAWGDFDNDGRLDAVLVGSAKAGNVAQVWRNNTSGAINSAPNAPTGLSARTTPTGVELQWAAASDGQTPAPGLSYNLAIGTSAGGLGVLGPQAFLADGWRRVPALGNVQLGTNARLTVPPGTYFWAVQAIDGAWAGGPFADGGSFVVGASVEVRITAYERRDLTEFWLRFAGAVGVNYRVERSTDLIQWEALGNATASAGRPGVYEFLDTGASAGRRFYRAIAP